MQVPGPSLPEEPTDNVFTKLKQQLKSVVDAAAGALGVGSKPKLQYRCPCWNKEEKSFFHEHDGGIRSNNSSPCPVCGCIETPVLLSEN